MILGHTQKIRIFHACMDEAAQEFGISDSRNVKKLPRDKFKKLLDSARSKFMEKVEYEESQLESRVSKVFGE